MCFNEKTAALMCGAGCLTGNTSSYMKTAGTLEVGWTALNTDIHPEDWDSCPATMSCHRQQVSPPPWLHYYKRVLYKQWKHNHLQSDSYCCLFTGKVKEKVKRQLDLFEQSAHPQLIQTASSVQLPPPVSLQWVKPEKKCPLAIILPDSGGPVAVRVESPLLFTQADCGLLNLVWFSQKACTDYCGYKPLNPHLHLLICFHSFLKLFNYWNIISLVFLIVILNYCSHVAIRAVPKDLKFLIQFLFELHSVEQEIRCYAERWRTDKVKGKDKFGSVKLNECMVSYVEHKALKSKGYSNLTLNEYRKQEVYFLHLEKRKVCVKITFF